VNRRFRAYELLRALVAALGASIGTGLLATVVVLLLSPPGYFGFAIARAVGLLVFLISFPTICIILALPLATRARPRDHLHCAGCGYDLTGNTSGRCPECARPIDAPHG
jgi:hypothetical protein